MGYPSIEQWNPVEAGTAVFCICKKQTNKQPAVEGWKYLETVFRQILELLGEKLHNSAKLDLGQSDKTTDICI